MLQSFSLKLLIGDTSVLHKKLLRLSFIQFTFLLNVVSFYYASKLIDLFIWHKFTSLHHAAGSNSGDIFPVLGGNTAP